MARPDKSRVGTRAAMRARDVSKPRRDPDEPDELADASRADDDATGPTRHGGAPQDTGPSRAEEGHCGGNTPDSS